VLQLRAAQYIKALDGAQVELGQARAKLDQQLLERPEAFGADTPAASTGKHVTIALKAYTSFHDTEGPSTAHHT
jgi:hypothetical protein